MNGSFLLAGNSKFNGFARLAQTNGKRQLNEYLTPPPPPKTYQTSGGNKGEGVGEL